MNNEGNGLIPISKLFLQNLHLNLTRTLYTNSVAICDYTILLVILYSH